MPVRASHTFAVWSSLPVTIRVPSGLNATLIHRARVPFEVEQGVARPRVPHLRRLVLTAGDDPRAVGAERHARSPQSVCPLRSSKGVPVRASHTFAVPSSLPVTIRVPSGLNATLLTAARVPFESSKVVARPRVPHLRRLVPLPVTIRVPSGLNDTLLTVAVCPLRSSRSVPVRASHTFAVPSRLPRDDPRAVRG